MGANPCSHTVIELRMYACINWIVLQNYCLLFLESVWFFICLCPVVTLNPLHSSHACPRLIRFIVFTGSQLCHYTGNSHTESSFPSLGTICFVKLATEDVADTMVFYSVTWICAARAPFLLVLWIIIGFWNRRSTLSVSAGEYQSPYLCWAKVSGAPKKARYNKRYRVFLLLNWHFVGVSRPIDDPESQVREQRRKSRVNAQFQSTVQTLCSQTKRCFKFWWTSQTCQAEFWVNAFNMMQKKSPVFPFYAFYAVSW